MRYVHKTFANQTIRLEGNEFHSCSFAHCLLLYDGTGPAVLEAGTFRDCEVSLDGPALQGVRFLADLYQMGGSARRIAESFIVDVRSGAKRQRNEPLGIHVDPPIHRGPRHP